MIMVENCIANQRYHCSIVYNFLQFSSIQKKKKRIKGKERLLDKRCGTLPYVAPEILVRPYSAAAADIWSCGIVLVAMLSGGKPNYFLLIFFLRYFVYFLIQYKFEYFICLLCVLRLYCFPICIIIFIFTFPCYSKPNRKCFYGKINNNCDRERKSERSTRKKASTKQSLDRNRIEFHSSVWNQVLLLYGSHSINKVNDKIEENKQKQKLFFKGNWNYTEYAFCNWYTKDTSFISRLALSSSSHVCKRCSCCCFLFDSCSSRKCVCDA